MPDIDFGQYAYYPSLRCTHGEHIGYQKLSPEDKDSLLPIFEVSQQIDSNDFSAALQLIAQSADFRPFILDFCRETMRIPTLPKTSKNPAAAKVRYEEQRATYQSYMAAYAKIMNGADGYANWRGIAKTFPNAVPTILFRDGSDTQVLRQAALLSRDHENLAIRLRRTDDPKMYPIVAQIASMLGSPDRLLVVLDVGYSRQTPAARVEFAREAIEQITHNMDENDTSLVRAVFLGSSFQQPDIYGLSHSDNKDWPAWEAARELFPFIYGDYSGVFRRDPSASPQRGWHARVVFGMPRKWICYRDPNVQDRDGWSRGATEIASTEEFMTEAPATWGATAISQAAKGHLHELDKSRYWYGVQVNTHLHQQIRYASEIADEYESGDEDE